MASSSGTWIALPAAEFGEMRALAAWARHTLTQPLAAHEGPGAAWYAENDRLRLAALDAIQGNQPPGPAGAKEGE